MIEENVHSLLNQLRGGNRYGEPVTLVAATKTRTPGEIQRAVDAGIGAVGENKVQEFTGKYALFRGAERHFIGRLQTNKVKYLVGKCDLIHSVDRDNLAEALSRRAEELGVVQSVLIEINIGREETKSGYPPEEALAAFERVRRAAGLKVRGFMAMLPPSEDENLLSSLADSMRRIYEEAKKRDGAVDCLSMGMSGDWKLCIGHGANMIRLGTAIFGERNYAG